MSTTQRVSDEVWRSAPEKKLPAGRVWAAVAVAAALILGAAWAAQSGRIVPHLVVGSSGSGAEAGTGLFDYRFDITNEGATDVELTGVRIDADWAAVTTVDRGWMGYEDRGDPSLVGRTVLPITIPAGGVTGLSIIVKVDCDKRRSEAAPLIFEARAAFGSHDVRYEPMGSAPMVPSSFMDEQPWSVAQADWVCTPYTGEIVDE